MPALRWKGWHCNRAASEQWPADGLQFLDYTRYPWLSGLIEDGHSIMKYRDPKAVRGMAEGPAALTVCEDMTVKSYQPDRSADDSAAASCGSPWKPGSLSRSGDLPLDQRRLALWVARRNFYRTNAAGIQEFEAFGAPSGAALRRSGAARRRLLFLSGTPRRDGRHVGVGFLTPLGPLPDTGEGTVVGSRPPPRRLSPKAATPTPGPAVARSRRGLGSPASCRSGGGLELSGQFLPVSRDRVARAGGG